MAGLIERQNIVIEYTRTAFIKARSAQAFLFFNRVAQNMQVLMLNYLMAFQLAALDWPVCADWQPTEIETVI